TPPEQRAVAASVPSAQRGPTGASRSSSTAREPITDDCLLAQAPSWEPCAREWKYGSLSASDRGETAPWMITWRCSAYQGKSRHAQGFPDRSWALADVRLV